MASMRQLVVKLDARHWNDPGAPLTLPPKLRAQKLTGGFLVKLADVERTTDAEVRTAGDIPTMRVTPVGTALNIDDVDKMVAYYTNDAVQGTSRGVRVAEDPDVEDDVDEYLGDCTNAINATRRQPRPSHAYPSFWYCRQCRNTPRRDAQTQCIPPRVEQFGVHARRRHKISVERGDVPDLDVMDIFLPIFPPILTTRARGRQISIVDRSAVGLLVHCVRYMRYLRCVGAVEETSIAMHLPISFVDQVLSAHNLDIGGATTMEERCAAIYRTVDKQDDQSVPTTNDARQDCEEYWLHRDDIVINRSASRPEPCQIVLPDYQDELVTNSGDILRDCWRHTVYYTAEKQTIHAQRSLYHAPNNIIRSLDEASSSSSVCISCDVPLRDVAVGGMQRLAPSVFDMEGDNGSVFKRPSLALFPSVDDEDGEVFGNVTCAALVHNVHSYFASLYPTDDTLLETAVCLSLSETTVTRCLTAALHFRQSRVDDDEGDAVMIVVKVEAEEDLGEMDHGEGETEDNVEYTVERLVNDVVYNMGGQDDGEET